MARLPAISLHQPWASLLFTEPRTKINETRLSHAPAKVIGKTALIHAAKVVIDPNEMDPKLYELCIIHFGEDFWATLPYGAFVGAVQIVSSEIMDENSMGDSYEDLICGNWMAGRRAIRTYGPQKFTPIPARGQQGWWEADVDLPPGSIIDHVA